MDKSIHIIHEFLQAFQPEVRGSSSDGLQPDLERQLVAFASGEIDEDDQESFSREVLSSEEALERLARLLGASER